MTKPHQLSQETIQKIEALLNEDLSSRKIADLLEISKSTVNNYRPQLNLSKNKQKLNITFLDIETAPDVAVTFKRFKANINQDSVLKDGGWLLSIAYKEGNSQIKSFSLTPEEAISANDSRLCAILFDIIEKSDILCGHNLDNFDLPVIKSRLLINGFPAIKKVRTIDTLKIARQMKFQSNKLDSLTRILTRDNKIENGGISLWVDCIHGNADALKKMEKYNAKDVEIQEKLYEVVKSYNKTPLNLGLNFDDNLPRCPYCSSAAVKETGQNIFTNTSVFSEIICMSCGARSRSKQSKISTEKRKNLLC